MTMSQFVWLLIEYVYTCIGNCILNVKHKYTICSWSRQGLYTCILAYLYWQLYIKQFKTQVYMIPSQCQASGHCIGCQSYSYHGYALGRVQWSAIKPEHFYLSQYSKLSELLFEAHTPTNRLQCSGKLGNIANVTLGYAIIENVKEILGYAIIRLDMIRM